MLATGVSCELSAASMCYCQIMGMCIPDSICKIPKHFGNHHLTHFVYKQKLDF